MKTAPEMLSHLAERSVTDMDFRAQLLSNPKGVMHEEFGITIPDSMDIEVHEGSMNKIHIALPPSQNMSEEQLEAISAGLSCCL